MPYDPQTKAEYNRQYYERNKKLKGRRPGGDTDTGNLPPKGAPPKPSQDDEKAAAARVTRLKAKVKTLEGALTEAMNALVEKRAAEKKAAKESSDGKSTAKEKQSSEEYRDKHKQELKTKEKQESKTASPSSSGGSSSSSPASSNSVSSMSASDLSSRIIKIKAALQEAKRQLSSATQKLGQMAHSAIMSDPKANEHFARFQSAERTNS